MCVRVLSLRIVKRIECYMYVHSEECQIKMYMHKVSPNLIFLSHVVRITLYQWWIPDFLRN